MHPSVDKELARITEAFRFVLVSETDGAEFVAAQLESASAPLAERREEWLVVLPETVAVVASDDPDSDTRFLKIFLIPDRSPVVIFFNPAHKKDSEELLRRLETALGESVDIWPASTPVSRDRRPSI